MQSRPEGATNIKPPVPQELYDPSRFPPGHAIVDRAPERYSYDSSPRHGGRALARCSSGISAGKTEGAEGLSGAHGHRLPQGPRAADHRERQVDVESSPYVGERTFHLASKKNVSDEIKRQNHLVEVTGLVKRSDLDDKGITAGPRRDQRRQARRRHARDAQPRRQRRGDGRVRRANAVVVLHRTVVGGRDGRAVERSAVGRDYRSS